MKHIFKTIVVLSFILNRFCIGQTVGLLTQNAGSLNGYVLFAPLTSNDTYLVDKCGKLVHTWASAYRPGHSVYLLEDGTLLRAGDANSTAFNTGGKGGIIEKFDWNGNITWSYNISNATECAHHDIEQLPNGNIIAIVWELKTHAQAIAAGRNPALVGNNMWGEKIVELQPVGSNAANIVWEWHFWDHLVQDFDSTKQNYGNVTIHPELLNLNFVVSTPNASDWLHVNSIDYNEALDQIVISSHNLSELYIIDHSTTTAEAATHSGGLRGKGGDILYRWGNPAAYNRGVATDQKLFGQHTVHWIKSGLNDAGNILIFNNGLFRPQGNYSDVEIIAQPIDSSGNYPIIGIQPFGPDSAYWNYTAPVPTDFYSNFISGAQRLSNGNMLICQGPQGIFFEIDTSKNIVWRYVNPVNGNGPISQGTIPTMNNVFRCTLYEPNYAGFNGQTLTPGLPVELNPLPYNCNMINGVDEFPSILSSVNIVNPFEDKIIFLINGVFQNATISLFDLTGNKISESTFSCRAGYNEVTIDACEFQSGLYWCRITSGKEVLIKKLIKQ